MKMVDMFGNEVSMEDMELVKVGSEVERKTSRRGRGYRSYSRSGASRSSGYITGTLNYQDGKYYIGNYQLVNASDYKFINKFVGKKVLAKGKITGKYLEVHELYSEPVIDTKCPIELKRVKEKLRETNDLVNKYKGLQTTVAMLRNSKTDLEKKLYTLGYIPKYNSSGHVTKYVVISEQAKYGGAYPEMKSNKEIIADFTSVCEKLPLQIHGYDLWSCPEKYVEYMVNIAKSFDTQLAEAYKRAGGNDIKWWETFIPSMALSHAAVKNILHNFVQPTIKKLRDDYYKQVLQPLSSRYQHYMDRITNAKRRRVSYVKYTYGLLKDMDHIIGMFDKTLAKTRDNVGHYKWYEALIPTWNIFKLGWNKTVSSTLKKILHGLYKKYQNEIIKGKSHVIVNEVYPVYMKYVRTRLAGKVKEIVR